MSLKLSHILPFKQPVMAAVEISSDDWVSTLYEKILHNICSHIPEKILLSDVQIYKTDLLVLPMAREMWRDRTLEWLREHSTSSLMNVARRVRHYFPGPPEDDKIINLVVSTPQILQLIEAWLGSNASDKQEIKQNIDRFIKARTQLNAPSETVKDASALSALLDNNGTHIYRNRVPAMIFSPLFAALHRSLANLDKIHISPADVDLAISYFSALSRFFKTEKERETTITEIIQKALGGTLTLGQSLFLQPSTSPAGKIKGTKITPDLTWWQSRFVIMILELKSLLGIGGDASFQAIADYAKLTSGEEYTPYQGYSTLPMVLTGLSGNRLEVAGAVCAGSIYVTTLLTLDLTLGSFSRSSDITQLARVFKALSCSREDLERYYLAVTVDVPLLSSVLPNPTPGGEYMLPAIQYKTIFSREGKPTTDLLDLTSWSTAMYTAIFEGNPVIVKFTGSYSERAHRILAESQLAPRLHFCGRVVGGVWMVVMDHLSGGSISERLQAPGPRPNILENVERAVDMLHKEDIVFGDLRENNIVYTETNGAFLVDFDWAGEDGKARYPSNINQGVHWHEDVRPYGIMYKAHDRWLLQQLRDRIAS